MKAIYTLFILLIPFIGISQTVYVTNTNDSGPGSLRYAVENASNGTTIRFDESINNQTITLTSNLNSNANIRIVGNSDDQTSSYIKFDNSFFSYGELIIDSIDIHPNSTQDFVFFHIFNNFQIKNSYANNIVSSAKIFSIQTDVSDININVQNCIFTNIAGHLFYLNAPKINFDLSFSYGNNIQGNFIDAFHLDGTSSVAISYSEFNNSNINVTTAIENLEINNSTFNSVNILNSYDLNMEYYFIGENITLNIDSTSFSNSNLDFSSGLYDEFSNDFLIANSNFNNCFLNFGGQGNIENVDINNFEYLSIRLININNSTISSNGSQFNSLIFDLENYNNNYSLDFNNNIFDCDIQINGNDLFDNYTFIESSLKGIIASDIDNLSLVSCILKDNDNLSLIIDNEECQNCNTFIKSSFFNNNQGGYYSFNYMIYQTGGFLEIENSTFYNNDNVIYFGSGTDINVKSSTFYQNDVCLNLIQWQPAESGSVSFYNSIVGNINFTFGSSIIASGYNIFSNSLNNLPETNFDGISNLNLSLIDDDSSLTPYLLSDYCSIAHDNGDPDFEGSIVNSDLAVNIRDIGSSERPDICDENESTWDCNVNFACIELSDESGNYQSLEECEANCSSVEPTWDCNDNFACIELSDGSGNFQSLEECEDNCNPIENSWNCVNDACVDPLDGSGEFSTLNDCEQVCQNISSIVETNLDINIYPNPSTNIFNLEFNSDTETEILVTNVLGEKVYFEAIITLGELNTQIDLSNYSRGIYNLTIKNSDRLSNHKLILQ